MNNNKVVLVNQNDQVIGLEDKITAHRGEGKLHRAVSVFVYRLNEGKIEFLIHKRSAVKQLWPGFWTNTICTHPGDGEQYNECAVRRLDEEFGIKTDVKDMQEIYKFMYRVSYNGELSENELDTVFICRWNGRLKPDRSEIEDYLWITFDKLFYDVRENSDKYTPWFQMILKDERFIDSLNLKS